jgi:outer membrane protein assembly factor BamB
LAWLPAVRRGQPSEPTLGADGVLYFGTASGQVFAIATDSKGFAVPSTSNWPRVQFDNCNSSNTSNSNCQ